MARRAIGHTIGLFINGNLTIARLLNPRLPYDPTKDLAPLSLVGVSPLVLAAPARDWGCDQRRARVSAGRAPGRQPLELARRAWARWAIWAPELLKARTGMAPVHILSRLPAVATAMLGGQLQMALLPPAWRRPGARRQAAPAGRDPSAGRSALVPA